LLTANKSSFLIYFKRKKMSVANTDFFPEKSQNMKQAYKVFSRLFLSIILIVAVSQKAEACHGVALSGLTFTPTATGVDINAFSDPATCGCGPYFMEAEVAFTAACLTGNTPACSASTWNTYPFYESGLNVPGYGPPSYTEACALEPYFTLTIPFADLCGGTQYVVRVREYVCGSSSAGPWSAIYTFTTPGIAPPVNVTTTADRYTACPGDAIQFNASANGGCPGSTYSYSWAPTTGLSNPNIANPVLTVQNVTTIYTLTVIGSCGAPVAASVDDTIKITIGPAPVPGIASAAPTSVCSGGSSIVSISGQDPASTVQWEVSPNGVSWFTLPGATGTTYNTGPLSSSLYYHAIVCGSGWWPGSGCGCTVTNAIQVIVNASPTANAGSNQTICNGACANLSGTGGVTYDWQPGSQSGQNITVCPTSPTTYTLTVTDANGCTGTDNVLVSLSTASVTASPDAAVCTGGSTILFASGPNGNTYNWSPNGTLTGSTTANPTATPASTTTYTVTATNTFGCTAMDSVTVTVSAAPPITVSNDTSFCAGGSATLTASGASSYTWQPGNLSGSSITVNPNSNVTYTVTGTSSSCMSTDSVNVSITPAPYVYAGPDFSICAGSHATMSVGASGTSYLWAPSASIIGSNTTQSVIAAPSAPTSYTVTVINAGGCISIDTINVTINPSPNVTASSPDNTICVGSSTTLNAAGATSYQWLPQVGLSNPTSSSTGANPVNTTTYQVVGTNSNGCTDTASITVTVNPLPAVWIVATPTECGDTTGALTMGGVVQGTAPFTYTIGSTTYNNLPINNLAEGNYTITTTDANGCTSTQSVDVGMVNNSFVNAVANPNFGTYPLIVGFGASGSSGLNNFAWSFGDTSTVISTQQSPFYTYTAPGTYTATVVAWNDNYACAVIDTVIIQVVEEALVIMPNVFTPNGDGTNDMFSARISGVKDLKVEMFTRWGNRVFEGEQNGLPPNPQDLGIWDGKGGNGKVVDDGVYYYVITTTGYDTTQNSITGFVQVIK
jgi:gliding motility-associated-like protein